jgi:hypothetical protein
MKNEFYNFFALSIIFLLYTGCRESLVSEAPEIGIIINDPPVTIENINIIYNSNK